MGGSSSSGSEQQAPQQQAPQQQAPQQMQQQPMMSSGNDKCFDFNNRFNDCMRFNNNNSTICQQSFDDLRNCQNNGMI